MTATSPAFNQIEQQICPALSIEGVVDPVVLHYFETLNAGNFQATASLFSEAGQLFPPFESPQVGPGAIATYLKAEAEGMSLMPRQGIKERGPQGETLVKVVGKVKTPWFKVNVAWLFALNAAKQIDSVAVKLLASPQELLKLRSLNPDSPHNCSG